MKIVKILCWALLVVILLFVVRELPDDQSIKTESIEIVSLPLNGDHSQILDPELSVEPVTEPTSEGAPKLVSLIVTGEESDVEWTSRTPAARRVRRITPDPALLSLDPVLQPGDLLELALFEDAVLSVKIGTVTRYPSGAVGHAL